MFVCLLVVEDGEIAVFQFVKLNGVAGRLTPPCYATKTIMEEVRCKSCEFNVIQFVDKTDYRIYPYLRDNYGDLIMWNVSPNHGRSYIVGKSKEDRFVISKGNGLSYSQYNFINTHEIGDETLGLMLMNDALRDFEMGLEISALGIKTNNMECVVELNETLSLPTGNLLHPVLLQYDVECPYRLSDAAFISKKDIECYVERWKSERFAIKHIIAAEILISNLRKMHDKGILHNAITVHNITWALELLDFELACSPNRPYDKEEENRHSKDLFPREVIETLHIIKYISGVLCEQMDSNLIENLFSEYGFNLCNYKVDSYG